MSLIELQNVEKIYGDASSQTHALAGVSFAIEEGEFVSIMGPSGSGKSTLLHILGLLDRPTRGLYMFNEKNVAQLSDDDSARLRNTHIGFIFQAFNLLPRTSVIENVMLPLLYSPVPEFEWDSRATAAAQAVGLSHRIENVPSELSGGEQQRVAIARALVTRPQIIFADEPTGNLDSKSGHAVMEILRGLNEKHGKTVVVITHETATAHFARRIIHMKDGLIEKTDIIKNESARDEYRK